MNHLDFCSDCGMKIEFATTSWRIDRQTGKEVKHPVSPCCYSELIDHEGSVLMRLEKIRKRKARRDARSRELVRELFGIMKPESMRAA